MQTVYIIKNDKIYEVTGEKEATKIDIVKGVPKKGKETIEYNPVEDFPYAFFEIRAKYSSLFEQPEVEEEIIEEPKSKKSEKSEKLSK